MAVPRIFHFSLFVLYKPIFFQAVFPSLQKLMLHYPPAWHPNIFMHCRRSTSYHPAIPVAILCTLPHLFRRTFLAGLTGVIIFIYIFKNVFLALEKNIIYRFSYRTQLNISTKLLKSYMNEPYTFHLRKNIAEISKKHFYQYCHQKPSHTRRFHKISRHFTNQAVYPQTMHIFMKVVLVLGNKILFSV